MRAAIILSIVIFSSLLIPGCKKSSSGPSYYWTVNDTVFNATDMDLFAFSFTAGDAKGNLFNLSFLNDSLPAGNYVVWPDTTIGSNPNPILSVIVSAFTQNGSHVYRSVGTAGDSVSISFINGRMKATLKNISMIDSSNSIVTTSANLYSQQ
jgi:hypothetical protein